MTDTYDGTGGGATGAGTLETLNASRALRGQPPIALADYEGHITGPAYATMDPDAQVWDAGTLYPARAAVRHADALWVAAQATQGAEPGTNAAVWMLQLEGVNPQAIYDEAQAIADAGVAAAAAQVTLAQGSAAAAQTAETGAVAARVAAEVARDAAQMAGVSVGTYTSTVAALAAVADGAYFWAPLDAETLQFYRAVSGVAVVQPGIAQPTATFVAAERTARETLHRSVGAWEPITLGLAVGYLATVSGAITSSSLPRVYDKFACDPGAVYRVSGALAGTGFRLITFYDDAGAVISQHEAGGASPITFNDYLIRSPANAAEMGVNFSLDVGSTQVFGVWRARQDATRGLDYALRLPAAEAVISDWAAQSLTLTATTFANNRTGALTSNASFKTHSRAVTPGDVIRISTTTAAGATATAAAVFVDASGYIVSAHGFAAAGAQTFTDLELEVPDRAATVHLTTPNANAAPTLARRVLRDITGDLSAAEAAITDLQAAVAGLATWVAQDADATTTTSYINYSTGAIVTLSGYTLYRFDVPEGVTAARITASVVGNVTALAVYKTAADAYLGYEHQGTGSLVAYVDEVLTLPAGTGRIYVSKPTAGPVPTIDFYMIYPETGPAVQAAVETTRIVRAAGVEYWRGKTAVWLGTSIPQGSGANSYVPKVATALGMTITNEALGSSPVRAGVRSQVTGPDPYGWSGEGYEQVSRALAGTHAEKQYLYDNWSTFQPLLVGAPGSVGPSDLAAWQAASYETKIAQHLGAGNRPDVWVIDHGINDYFMVNDVATAGAGGRDRLTYLGAMNFLIDLIRADDPKAKILLIGHYEDQQRPTIAQAQAIVANLWGIPICDLWDRLGWSSQVVSTTGRWVSGVWTPGAGSATNMTGTQIWMADNLHPHSDTSGAATDRVAEVIAAWLAQVR